MLRRIHMLLVLLVVLIVGTACSHTNSDIVDNDNRLTVTVSSNPMKELVVAIGKEYVSI